MHLLKACAKHSAVICRVGFKQKWSAREIEICRIVDGWNADGTCLSERFVKVVFPRDSGLLEVLCHTLDHGQPVRQTVQQPLDVTIVSKQKWKVNVTCKESLYRNMIPA